MAFTTREKLEPSRRMYEKMSPLDGMERMELMKSTIETNWMEFKNSAFVAREGDVFIATFPRCGTAWVQQISKLIRNSGVEDGTGIDEAFPWIDLMSPEEAEVNSSLLKLPCVIWIVLSKTTMLYVYSSAYM